MRPSSLIVALSAALLVASSHSALASSSQAAEQRPTELPPSAAREVAPLEATNALVWIDENSGALECTYRGGGVFGVRIPEAPSFEPTATPRPRIRWADASRTGLPFSKDPSVIEHRGRYLLYYSMPPSTNVGLPPGWAIGILESPDLIGWRKVAELLPEQDCESRGLCAPDAVVVDGRVHLFYQTYGNGPRDAICHAVSQDGLHFARDPSNPVFRPHGSWTSGRAIDANACPVGDQLLMWFATRDPTGQTQMLGVAAAPLNSDFGRSSWKQLSDAPVLFPELPWEKRCIEAPSVLRRDNRLYLFYAGGFNNEPQQIGVAVSTNGLTWTRCSDQPLLPPGKPGDWNSSESGHPGVLVNSQGRTFLFYQGNNDHGRTWFLSVAELGWNGDRPFILP